MRKVSTIYHKDCLDGFMSYYLVTQFIEYQSYITGEEITHTGFPMHYGDEIPEEVLSSDELYIVDFSFPPNIMETLESIPRILMFDHHESTAESFGGYGFYNRNYMTKLPNTDLEHISLVPRNSRGIYIFEKEHSGCGLILKYLFDRNESLLAHRELEVVSAIEDRDLWKFTYRDTKAICMVMSEIPKSIIYWKELLRNDSFIDFSAKINEANTKIEFSDNLTSSIAKKAIKILFQEKLIPIVNTGIYISEVGNFLASIDNISMSFFILTETQEVVVSMRSISEEFDISVMCEKMGGGGHKCAAGFKIPLSMLPDLLSGNL